MEASRRAGVGEQVAGDPLGESVLDPEPVPVLQPALARRAGHRLDDAAAVEGLEEFASPVQAGFHHAPVDLGEPLLAKPKDELAARPTVPDPEQRDQGGDEQVELVRIGRVAAGIDFLDLVEQDHERPVQPSLLGVPGFAQGKGRGGSVRSHHGGERRQQAQLGVAAAVANLVAARLQPGHDPRVEQRRLAHAGRPVQEQDRRPGLVGDSLVE